MQGRAGGVDRGRGNSNGDGGKDEGGRRDPNAPALPSTNKANYQQTSTYAPHNDNDKLRPQSGCGAGCTEPVESSSQLRGSPESKEESRWALLWPVQPQVL